MTNADVIKMVESNLDESIIVAAIQGSEPKFDTSAEGIIALSAAKVPKPVIEAVIKRSSAPSTSTAAAPQAEAADLMSPSEIILIDGESKSAMRYLTPQVRTAARGLGYGGVASYSVLRGLTASLRLKNRTPSFLVSVPNQAQPESYFTLASFEPRPKNGTREVMIGGGFMSYSTGIHPKRVMACSWEKAADQSKATKNFTIYTLTPKAPLAPGEYAVILYTGEMQGMVSAWFAGTGNSYFDFGIDK